jgi:hypothetical protein
MGDSKDLGPIIDPGTKKWLMLVFAVVVVIVIGIIYMTANAGSKFKEFAKCTDEAGAKMYGAFWCSACSEQKSRFGNSFEEVNYIECSNDDRSQNAVCNDAGIGSYPTWEFADGSRIQGVTSLQQLSDVTGCSLDGK